MKVFGGEKCLKCIGGDEERGIFALGCAMGGREI